jgi:thiopeptide-type bacteriocin biosynthesis protein
MNEACLYVALGSPQESHDRLLRELVAPIVREIRGHPDLDSLFFVRYADPDWQLRFRVLGRPGWIETSVRPRVESAIRPFVEEGVVGRVEFGTYVREWERYGGPEGMLLAEKIFLHDSLACLDVLESERDGTFGKSRREYALALTEMFLDLFGFDASRRLEFYREGHAWAFRDGVFREDDRPRLDRRYLEVREGLKELVRDLRCGEPSRAFGGIEPERIARTSLEAMRPVVDEIVAKQAAGTIRQNLVYLAWSYTHLHCNRMGIDTVPEAVLRYLMFRLHEETPESGPSS